AARIGGPYQGTRIAGSSSRNAASSRDLASSNQASTSAPDRWRYAAATPSGSGLACSAANTSGSTAERTAASSNQARWVTWSSTDQPAAGVGRRQPSSSSGTSRARSTADSAARSSASPD